MFPENFYSLNQIVKKDLRKGISEVQSDFFTFGKDQNYFFL